MSYDNLDESKDEIRLITLLPESGELGVVHCKLETQSLASLTPEYRNFLSNSDTDISSRRKVVCEWSRSHSPLDVDNYVYHYGPPAHYYRFIWGDYAALSYVWGDENEVSMISVNGQMTQVTSKLEEALRAFCARAEFEDGFKLWVDAICINQRDLEERSRQVKRMRDIYGSAWTVIAWLGEAGDDSDRAIELVRNLAGFSRTNGGEKLKELLLKKPGYLGNGCWLALERFMARPYWYRLWIIQEIVMGASAVTIRCGASSIDWTSFSDGIGLLHEHLWLVKDDLLAWEMVADGMHERCWRTTSLHLVHQDLSVLCRNEESTGSRLSFGRILDIANSANCSDPRDKVYALVSLMDCYVASQLVPDYEMDPFKIYTATAKAFIEAYRNLEPIRDGNPWGPTGSPSWAADWQWKGRFRYSRLESQRWVPPRSLAKSTPSVSVHTPYRASGDTLYQASFSDDGLLLTCGGFVVDKVSSLSARGKGYFAWSEISIVQPGPYKSVYGNASDTAEALYRTLVLDRVWGRGKASERHAAIFHLPSTFVTALPQLERLGWNWLAAQEGYYFRWEEWRSANRDFWIGDRQLHSYFSDKIPADASEYDVSEVYSCFDHACKKRRLITTRNGYIGWAPDNTIGCNEAQTKQGDLIVILFGCSTPIIIRPYGQYFQVVGEAYVQGLMDGEALRFLEAGRAQTQNFTFC